MQRLTVVGLCLIAGSFALGALRSAVTSAGGDGFVFFAAFTGPMFLAGVICLIVAGARGRGQQQQQQVIVYTGAPHAVGTPYAQPTPMGSPCPACGQPNEAGAAFCASCGGPMARPRAAATGARAAPARGAPKAKR